MPSSRGSSPPRDGTRISYVSHIRRRVLYHWHHLGSPRRVMLLLLSRFSRVRLCASPKTAAQPGSPVPGILQARHWNELPFPSPVHKSESEVSQLCPTLSDPMDCSPPGSSAHGIFQARVLGSPYLYDN